MNSTASICCESFACGYSADHPQQLLAVEFTSRSAPPSAGSEAFTAAAEARELMPAWIAELDDVSRALVWPHGSEDGGTTVVSDGETLRLLSGSELRAAPPQVTHPSLYLLRATYIPPKSFNLLLFLAQRRTLTYMFTGVGTRWPRRRRWTTTRRSSSTQTGISC